MAISSSFGPAAISLVSCLIVAGCASERQEEAPPAPVVDGVYRLDARDASTAIDEMEFRGDQYWLAPSGCTEDACKEHGTFEIDRANHLLALVAEGTGRRVQLPFEITSMRNAPSVTASSEPAPASIAGQLAPMADSLVAGGQEPLVGQSRLTVGSFKLVGQSYLLEYDDCGGRDMVTIARAACADFKMPTKAPRIRCLLMNDENSCNGASMRSCLKDAPDNDALSRYESYRDGCRDSGDFPTETRSSMNNGLNPFVMTVCCKPYTCPDGVRIDGTAVTGKQGETVCGTTGTKWWCGPGGKEEGVGQWRNLNVACSR